MSTPRAAASGSRSIWKQVRQGCLNFFDWSMIGCQMVGKGVWVLATVLVVVFIPLRRAVETEQDLLNHEQQQNMEAYHAMHNFAGQSPPTH